MFLVTGATGNVGGQVVRQLVDGGERVRALTRNPASATLPAGVDVVGGDLADPATLNGAFDGVERAFLFPEPRTATAVAALARERGVRRVVVLSSQAVTQEGDNPIAVMHRVVERAVADSGLDWTFVRPGGFATNTLNWAPSIRAEGVVRMPYPELSINPIHEADIAAVSVVALLQDGHAGASYQLSGPEALTQADQVRAIGAAIGRDLRIERQTLAEAREDLRHFAPEEIVNAMLEYFESAIASGAVAPVLPTVQEVTGRPARTFAEWAVEHADDF